MVILINEKRHSDLFFAHVAKARGTIGLYLDLS